MAVSDLLLGPAYDVVIVDGQLLFTATEGARIAQRLAQRLLTFTGEWFANANYGVAYITNVFGAPADETLLAEAFRPALSTELETIISITATVQNRGLSLRFIGVAPSGETVAGSALITTIEGGVVVDGIQITVDGVPVVIL